MIETTDELKHRTGQSFILSSPLCALDRLAWNYWWSWAPDGAPIFRDLDAELWETCEQNPRLLLNKVSESRVAQMAADQGYLDRVNKLSARFDQYMAQPALIWQGSEGRSQITSEHPVTYFCAEFGVHNSLPLYSGGLGILAGDHLKSASDTRLPLVGVGLLYRYGYFRQHLRFDGWQEENYGETLPEELPIYPIKAPDGSRLLIEVLIRERLVRAQVWRADVGRVPLYLLDTNIPDNEEIDRLVTGHLYGGDRETRIVQEMLLGIGGIRLLRRLGIEPHVFHLNEGHSAFLTLELARQEIQSKGLIFGDAANLVRERCVFTTHTPVSAGNDEFQPDLVKQAFGPTYEGELGLTSEQFMALGRIDASNMQEPYGLTPLAIRMCRSTNGVSRKHGEVSRALWQKLWPTRRIEEVPITYITNGVHAPTWVAPPVRSLYEKYLGDEWSAQAGEKLAWEQGISEIPDKDLWIAHNVMKDRLIDFIRYRLLRARLDRTESVEYAEAARNMFDPRLLTIGFARRVAAYKRWNLLLHDPERLLRILNNQNRPVQFVFAGKAHPQDSGSKLVLQQLALWKYDPQVRNRVVFLEDYDQEVARHLVQSVDVWLNVPRRPLEASGTSGEKVAINGGLNLSVLDGWWLEGYEGTNGFAIGSAVEGNEADDVDASDAESLYSVLEQEVVPLFYERGSDGLPHKWISMMRRSIATLVPQFNSDRMVRDYANRIYS